MNREIKFRGRKLLSNEFVYGYLTSLNEIRVFITDEWKGQYDTFLIDPNTIGQFTGLHDKNGNHIFEGDIVTYDGTPYLVNALKATGVIVNYKGSLALKYKANYKTSDGRDFYNYYLFSCEDFFDKKSIVIGNIYENPELLKN